MFLFLLLLLSAALSIAQPTSSDGRSREECNSHFEYIRKSLDKVHQNLEQQNCSPNGNRCPPGFAYDAAAVSKCYSVVTQKLTRDQAQARCKQLHPKAHLVTIGSALENQLLREIINDYDCVGRWLDSNNKYHGTNHFWTSGKRKQDNCSFPFHWVPSDRYAQELSFTNWCWGEPNCYFPQENCIALTRAYCGGYFGWNDVLCSWLLCSVCEVVRFG